MKDKSSLINGSLFSLFSFFNQGVGFLLLIILAKYILPDDYGKLSLYNTVVMFLGYFVGLSSQGYLSVSFFKNSRDVFVKDVSAMIMISLGFSVVFSIIVLLLGDQVSKVFELSSQFLWYSIIVTVFNFWWNLFLDYLRVRERIILYGIGSCGYAISNFSLSLLFVIGLRLNWEGRVYSQLLCTLACGLLAITLFANKKILNLKSSKWNDVKRVAIWGIPLIPHLATIWIKQGCDRLIINNYYSLSEVGIFSFALTLMSVIVAMGMAFNSSFSVTIYKLLSGGDKEINNIVRIKKQERLSIVVYSLATLVILLFAYLLVPIFLSQYEESLGYFAILSLSGLFQCIYFVYSNVLFYNGKNKQIMYITFGCSIIHLILSFLLTRYSLFVTCSIYAVTQFLVMSLVIIYNNKIINERYEVTQ